MYIILPGRKEPRGLLQENIGIAKKAALIIAWPVAILCSTATANSRATAAGPVFLNPSAKAALFMHPIIPMV